MTREKHRKRNNQIALIREIILCIITLFAITLALFFLLRYHAEKNNLEMASEELAKYTDPSNPYYSQAEVDTMLEEAKQEGIELEASKFDDKQAQYLSDIKSMLLKNNSSIEVIRYLFPNDIIVVDDAKYNFIPISDTLVKNDYDYDLFIKNDNGFMSYSDASRITKIGIDVSQFQEDIDWTKVANSGIDYAIIRMGKRGYTEGELFVDDTFESNIKKATKNNIDIGVYFFTQAISEEEAIEEAKFVLDHIEPYKVKYPVIIDVEAVGGQSSRTNDLTKEERTKYVKAFCETIKNAGYTPMIYGNLKSFFLMLELDELEDIPKWFASYSDTPYYPYTFDMWQYTDSGEINGIKGKVDLNISFINP